MYGLLNYYSFVDNRANLWWLVHGLKYSCALTFRLKYKLRFMSKVFRKFGRNLKDPETGVGLYVPKTFGRTRKFLINPVEPLKMVYSMWYTKLTKSNLGKSCIICGDSNVQMHHVRKIRELKARTHLDWFTMQMAAIQRKQVPLCQVHHTALHQNTLTTRERTSFVEGLELMKKQS